MGKANLSTDLGEVCPDDAVKHRPAPGFAKAAIAQHVPEHTYTLTPFTDDLSTIDDHRLAVASKQQQQQQRHHTYRCQCTGGQWKAL